LIVIFISSIKSMLRDPSVERHMTVRSPCTPKPTNKQYTIIHA
jgi:hypothetical protein